MLSFVPIMYYGMIDAELYVNFAHQYFFNSIYIVLLFSPLLYREGPEFLKPSLIKTNRDKVDCCQLDLALHLIKILHHEAVKIDTPQIFQESYL